MSAYATSSPSMAQTRWYLIRPPSLACTWRNETSWLSVAEYSLNGTDTSPKDTAPFQIARIVVPPRGSGRRRSTKRLPPVLPEHAQLRTHPHVTIGAERSHRKGAEHRRHRTDGPPDDRALPPPRRRRGFRRLLRVDPRAAHRDAARAPVVRRAPSAAEPGRGQAGLPPDGQPRVRRRGGLRCGDDQRRGRCRGQGPQELRQRRGHHRQRSGHLDRLTPYGEGCCGEVRATRCLPRHGAEVP